MIFITNKMQKGKSIQKESFLHIIKVWGAIFTIWELFWVMCPTNLFKKNKKIKIEPMLMSHM